MIIKCKMCGGNLSIQEGNPICECEFCGTKQTIPQVNNEKKGNLFNRANRLRMGAEFDKAATVYASIVAEFPEEAEAYWGLCLCKYGIEYVDDPATGAKIPTCHRTLSASIMDDSDFIQACENADPIAKKFYREEAKTIDRLQQDILSIVANEKPYDVFICYKETDEEGNRTEDSVIAQDIYEALTGKGLKVFFSRITLEDKLGQQYEPYIYSALHSARVMLAIGTKYEYYDAVWVKNEWARFLDMMRSEKEKTIIPCYKDIDAYDMPREFKNLQAQDMGKLGWLQDLTRGVLKLCGKGQPTQVVQQVVQTHDPSVESLLRRAFVFLEDHKWESAKEYAEKVLDHEVENSRAYLVELMASREVGTESEWNDQIVPIDDDENYRKIIRFGDDELVNFIKRKNAEINARLAEEKRRERVNELLERIRLARTVEECASIITDAKENDYNDSELQEALGEVEKKRKKYEAKQKAEELRKKNNERKEDCSRYPRECIGAKESVRIARLRVETLQRQINLRKKDLESIWDMFGGKKRKAAIEEEICKLQQELDQAREKHEAEQKKMNELLAQESIRTAPPLSYSELTYQIALIFYEAQDYESAYQYYNQIKGYSDVDERLSNDPNLQKINMSRH